MFIENKQVSSNDFDGLEKIMKKITNEKQLFERLEISKQDLKRLFDYNPFKVRIINEKVNTPTTTVYRCGPLIDLCRGPHIKHTGKVKAFSLTKNSSNYWEGDSNRESFIYNVFMVYHFQKLNNLKNGNIFKKKQLNVIIVK
jgi:threonyl-tRNA synthetase